METLKALREAPVVEEDYRGPVLFGPDAASDVFFGMVGENVLGNRPKPGESARTTGDYASNYKGRVLPAFLSVADDPTMKTFGGKGLIGSYEMDDEGVRAAAVPVIEDGKLVELSAGPRADPRFSRIERPRPRRAGPESLAEYRQPHRPVESNRSPRTN